MEGISRVRKGFGSAEQGERKESSVQELKREGNGEPRRVLEVWNGERRGK